MTNKLIRFSAHENYHIAIRRWHNFLLWRTSKVKFSLQNSTQKLILARKWQTFLMTQMKEINLREIQKSQAYNTAQLFAEFGAFKCISGLTWQNGWFTSKRPNNKTDFSSYCPLLVLKPSINTININHKLMIFLHLHFCFSMR